MFLPFLRILIISFFCITLLACDKKDEEVAVDARPIRYTIVTLDSGQRQIVFSGTAKAETESEHSFKVSGTLDKRAVNVGDTVQMDDLLARLDKRDYQVLVRESEANLSRAIAKLRNAQANYDRVSILYENQNAAKSELDAARADAESNQANVIAHQEKLDADKLRLSYTDLYAPMRCRVANTFVEPNQNVAAGQPIVELHCGVCPEVIVSVSESFISHIKPGEMVSVSASAFPKKIFKGVVTEIGQSTGEAGTVYPVTIKLSQPCPHLLSGMAADVTFSYQREQKNAVVIPVISVGQDDEGNFVYIIETDEAGESKAHKRRVSIADYSQDGVIIGSGLTVGETIATAGVRRINDGQTVLLLEKLKE